MKNLIKTAIAVGTVALNMMVAKEANAETFRLILTGNQGNEVIAELEGTENEEGTGINVDSVTSVVWYQNGVEMARWNNIQFGGIRDTYIANEIIDDDTYFKVYEDTQDGYNDLYLNIKDDSYTIELNVNIMSNTKNSANWSGHSGSKSINSTWRNSERIISATITKE